MPAANIAPMDSQAKPHASSEPLTYWGRVRDVAAAFFPMGFIAFGGPAAHIGLFLKTFVEGERPWLDEQRFMELMSLGQAMPGPTSTQMATAMGITRAGTLGGLVSFWLFDWVGFAVQLSTGAAVYYLDLGALDTYKMVVLGAGPAAISLVFLAARMLGNKACGDDPLRISLALFTCFVALLLPREHMRWAAFAFPGLILFGGLVTALDARRPSRRAAYEKALSPPTGKGLLKQIGIPRPAGLLLAMVAVGLFPFAWVARDLACGGFGGAGSRQLAVFSSLYWMGFSIYGGGQVVLPMLESEFTRGRCEPGETGSFPPLDAETFGFGLALAQSLPGPLFNLSAFLGAAVAGVGGGIVGFLGLFGPGILLIYALMPFWESLRRHEWVRCALVGMNASAVGLVFQACVTLWAKYCTNGAEAAVCILAMAMHKRFAPGDTKPLALRRAWPAVVIFSCATLCLVLFFLDLNGAYGDWCHVAKYGDFATQPNRTEACPSAS